MHTMHLCKHTMHRPVVAACGVKQHMLRGRAMVAVRADMKKEKKKLAKQQMKLEEQLCSFKKKLEQLTAGDCDAGIISSVPVTSALISQLLTQLQSHPMLEEVRFLMTPTVTRMFPLGNPCLFQCIWLILFLSSTIVAVVSGPQWYMS